MHTHVLPRVREENACEKISKESINEVAFAFVRKEIK